MKDIWDQIADQFHEDMDNEQFGPDFHSHTEGIFNDRTGVYLLKDRYQAWIFRMSWGNNSQFCCHRPLRNPQNLVALTQAEAARALGCAAPVLCRLTKRFVEQGRIHVDEEGRIILNKKLKKNIGVAAAVPVDQAFYVQRWRTDFPAVAHETDEARARMAKDREIVQKGRKHYLHYLKHLTRSGNPSSAPVIGDLFGSGNDEVRRSGNENAPAPVTASETSATDSLDSRARSTLNIKHKETLVSESVKEDRARRHADSLTEIGQAVAQAYGAPLQPNDHIPGELLGLGIRAGLTTKSLCRWIYEFSTKKRQAGYPITSPQLFTKAAKRDLEPWARANALVVTSDAMEEARAASPVPRVWTAEQDIEFAGQILGGAPDDTTEEEKQWARGILAVAKGATP